MCSNGLTPLGAAVHLGNILICEILLDSYCNQKDSCVIHKKKKVCLNQNNENKNIGYYVVRNDLAKNDDEVYNVSTPEGMEALEWDVEFKESDEVSPDESYSSIYKWYADILNRTSDLLKNPFPNDINQMDRYGRTAIHYAVENGNLSVVQLLISSGCNVNNTSTENMSALHLASRKGFEDIVSLLINSGARIDHINNTKSTALHLAAVQGHWKVVQLLLQHGSNINSLDSNDRTPLMQAVSQHKIHSVEILVKNGAKVNIEDVNGHTPLCEAVWTNSITMVQILILAGAKITQSHYLLHYAVQYNQLDIVKLLVSAGSVINLRDSNGNTPLILASRNGHIEIVNILLDHGKSFNNVLLSYHFLLFNN